MSALIQIGNDRVTVRRGRWSSQDGRWVKLLEFMTPAGGPSPSVGDVDRFLAERATARLNAAGQPARLVSVSPALGEPGEVN